MLRDVDALLAEESRPVLILFQVDRVSDDEEIVLAVRGAGDRPAFWQLFGRGDDMNTSFWRQKRMDRGGVLPHLAVSFFQDWSYRRVARRFSRWRKATLS